MYPPWNNNSKNTNLMVKKLEDFFFCVFRPQSSGALIWLFVLPSPKLTARTRKYSFPKGNSSSNYHFSGTMLVWGWVYDYQQTHFGNIITFTSWFIFFLRYHLLKEPDFQKSIDSFRGWFFFKPQTFGGKPISSASELGVGQHPQTKTQFGSQIYTFHPGGL